MPSPPANNDAAELIVVLDHVVRELVRLQDQIDLIRDAVEDLSESVGSGKAQRSKRSAA